ncbi:MAG: efflux RND transporter periplasmic adaptor subunit, partial [Treponema sp.]
IGLKANIVLEAYPDVVFTATVSSVSPVVDSSSRTKEVILNFDKQDDRINAGMFAKVTLYTLNYSNAVTVPEDCIIEKSNKKYVYVVKADGETVSEREVTIGETVDNVIQLLTGVSDGETVVVEGMRVLTDGSKILDITNGVAASENTTEPSDKNTSKEKHEESK